LFSRSRKLYTEALQYMPGGVNSPVRAFKAVGGDPLFLERGEGSRVYDADGNSYIDYVCSWGPLILGHAHPEILEVIREVSARGTSFGAPTVLEIEMARLLVEAVPSLEMVRMVNSGTEAVMGALRLARGYTGREKIVKFTGCYHGHADSLLIKAGSGVTTLGLPDSPGVTTGTARDTLTAPYNDIAFLEELFSRMGEEIAAIIVEPVAGNMGVVPPKPGFLEGLRKLTKRFGSLLIFDEVMTGFRLSFGGAQDYYGVKPDITTLGKIIGGGLPVGAYGGSKEVMKMIAPSGPVYQAGTLSGNPLAMAVGIKTLQIMGQPGTYEKLEEKTRLLNEGLRKAAQYHDLPLRLNSVGSMFSLFFTPDEVYDFDSAASSHSESFNIYFKAMLERGIYIAPSQFEAGFLSLSHSQEDIEATIDAAMAAFKIVKETTQQSINGT